MGHPAVALGSFPGPQMRGTGGTHRGVGNGLDPGAARQLQLQEQLQLRLQRQLRGFFSFVALRVRMTRGARGWFFPTHDDGTVMDGAHGLLWRHNYGDSSPSLRCAQGQGQNDNQRRRSERGWRGLRLRLSRWCCERLC